MYLKTITTAVAAALLATALGGAARAEDVLEKVKAAGVLTVGTGLGNARFTKRPVEE